MAFLWENFASESNDHGVQIEIEFQGEKLPFRIKRHLTIDERQRANDAAFKIDLDKDGKPTISKQDQAAFTKEVVLIGLRAWPFEYSEGNPVPLIRKNIAALDGALLSELAGRILGTTEVKKEELVPFGKESEDHSLQVEQVDRS